MNTYCRVRCVASCGVLIALGSHSAAASAQVAGQSPLPMSSAFGAIVGLAVVVALIFVLGWIMRRLGGPGGMQKGPLRVLGATSVGQRERVVLVRYQDSILVLGVAAGHVSLLKETQAPPESASPAPATLPSFLSRLRAAGGATPDA